MANAHVDAADWLTALEVSPPSPNKVADRILRSAKKAAKKAPASPAFVSARKTKSPGRTVLRSGKKVPGKVITVGPLA